MAIAEYVTRFDKDRFYITVGERIIATREALGWNQQKLADAANLSKSTIHNAEVGTTCSVLVLTRIAEALDVLVDELIPTEAT